MAISQGLQSLGEAKDSFINLTGVIGDFVTKLFAKNAAETASVAATTASIAAKQTETVVTTEAAVAQEGLNTAMAMNPIGAVVLALTALTAGIVYYISTTKEAGDSSDDLAEKQKRQAEQSKKNREFVAKEGVEFFKLASQLKQTNAGSKERSKLITDINAKYGTTLQNLKDEAGFQRAINDEIRNYINVLKLKFKAQSLNEAMQNNFNKQLELEGKIQKLNITIQAESSMPGRQAAVADAKKKQAELQQELDATKGRFDGYAGALQNAEERMNNLTNGGTKFAESNKNVKDSVSDTAEEVKDYAADLNKFLDAIESDRQGRIKNAREKELQEAANKYDDLTLLADKAGRDTTQITEQYQNDIKNINDKYDALNMSNMKASEDKIWKDELDRRQLEIDFITDEEEKKVAIKKLALDQDYVNLQNALDNKLITEEEYQNLSAAAFIKYNKALNDNQVSSYAKDIADKKSAYEQKAALEMQYVDIANQAANLIKQIFGKSKAAQKTAVIIESAAGIAKMVIANKLANIGALATPQAIASSGVSAVPVIAANNISTALGIAANVAATAKALKEIGGGGSAPSGPSIGGGGGASGGGTGGGVMAPNFNVVGNNGLNQLAQLQQQPIKAYVVGAEVTTQQALDRNRITNATL